MLAAVVAGSTAGYLAFGFGLLDALYQTVTTVTTVGFREVRPFGPGEKAFTIVVVVVGVGTALYTFTSILEVLVEGEVAQLLGRRRMDRDIAKLSGHLIVCGFGRVGSEVTRFACRRGEGVVVVDRDPARVARAAAISGCAAFEGDATDEKVLDAVGIGRARALVAALDGDADNLYVTLTARGMNPDLFIIARARVEASEGKLRQAGANRVVNPQRLGGARMAAFAFQPHVSQFVDVVMHERTLDFRLEEVEVGARSALAGRTLRDAHIRDRTGAMILAIAKPSGAIDANPPPETVIEDRDVLIAIGTESQLAALVDAARPPS